MAVNSVLASMAVKISANTAQFNASLADTNKKLDGFGSKITGALKGIAAGFGAISLVKIGSDIINITGEFQKFQAVLTNTLGSRSGANDALKNIKDFASKTPFSVQELTGSFVKLVNSGFKPTIKELTNLGDLASSQGKGFDQLAEAIIDAQTGEFERLKEFGIRSQKEGDKVTFTFKGVKQQVDFTSESIQNYILSLGTLTGVSGGMSSISDTLGGKISNLGDNFDSLLNTIGNRSSGLTGAFLDLVNSALGGLNSALDDNVKNLQNEQAEINVLVGAITDVNVSTEVRSSLISQLNSKYPDFLKNLDAEKVTNEQLTLRLKDVNEQFLRKIALTAAESRFKDSQEDILDLIDEEVQLRKKLEEQQIKQQKLLANDQKGIGVEQGRVRIASMIAKTEGEIAQAQNKRADIQKELSDKLAEYNKLLNIFDTSSKDYFENDSATKALSSVKDQGEKLNKVFKDLSDTLNYSFGSNKNINDLNKQIKELKEQLEFNNDPSKSSGIKDQIKAIDEQINNLNEGISVKKPDWETFAKNFKLPDYILEQLKKDFQALSNTFTVDLGPAISGFVTDFSQSLGELIGGSEGIGKFSENIKKAIGNLMISIGSGLIALGIGKIAAKIPGPAAIAAGVVLVAAGAALSASTKKMGNVLGSGSETGGSNQTRTIDNYQAGSFNIVINDGKPFEFRLAGDQLVAMEKKSAYVTSKRG